MSFDKKQYDKENRIKLNEYCNNWRKHKLSSMTPEEREFEKRKTYLRSKFNYDNVELKKTLIKSEYDKLKNDYVDSNIDRLVEFFVSL